MSKRVRFRDGSIASTTMTTMSYDSWYQSDDYKNFLRDRQRTAKALREVHGDASSLDKSRYCLRGLEGSLSGQDDHRLLSYGRERRSQQTSIIRMVLEAQHEQRQLGIQNIDTIRAFYMMLSKVSRDRAMEVAALDAAAVTVIVDDDVDKVTNYNVGRAEMWFQQQQQSMCRTVSSNDHSLTLSKIQEDAAASALNSGSRRRPLQSGRPHDGRSKRPRHGRSKSPSHESSKEEQQVLLFV